MTLASPLRQLLALGPLPAAQSLAADDFPLAEFEQLLGQLAWPPTAAEATQLAGLGPPPATGCFGLEWALVHAIETLPAATLRKLLPTLPPTEVTRLLAGRLP